MKILVTEIRAPDTLEPMRTLADMDLWTLCRVKWCGGFRERFHGPDGKAWGFSGRLPLAQENASKYPVVSVIGRLVFPTSGTEVKVELAEETRGTLADLEPWTWAPVVVSSLGRDIVRCRDEENRVWSLNKAGLPDRQCGMRANEYTVTGEPLGQVVQLRGALFRG